MAVSSCFSGASVRGYLGREIRCCFVFSPPIRRLILNSALVAYQERGFGKFLGGTFFRRLGEGSS